LKEDAVVLAAADVAADRESRLCGSPEVPDQLPSQSQLGGCKSTRCLAKSSPPSAVRRPKARPRSTTIFLQMISRGSFTRTTEPNWVASTQFFAGTVSIRANAVQGIAPSRIANPLSVSPAFYMLNSPAHTLLHISTQHPVALPVPRNPSPPSLLVFELDTAVLHSRILPTPGTEPFRVDYFADTDAEREGLRQVHRPSASQFYLL
jgi:hypothetical protein